MTAVKKTTLPKEVSDLTEEQALWQMKQGSQDALAWFIQRYGAYVSTIIHNIIGQRMSNADVEEVASDVFLALWNNAGKILPNAARSWLATVARNTARSRLRRASDTLPLDEEAVIVDDRTPEATLERREQAVRVRMALLSLNPVDFSSLERDASLGAQLLENRVMQNYVKLNQTGRDKILELMDDFVQIDKYKAKSKKAK